MTKHKHKIIDGDGHVVEDHSAIAGRMPKAYSDRFGLARGAYPPNDHLHAANAHYLPPGAFAKVGREGWIVRPVGDRLEIVDCRSVASSAWTGP